MDPHIFLIASAQIAVAIAGFAGVVAAFRDRSVHTWGEVERFWFRLLLLNSTLSLGLSIIGLFFIVLPSAWGLTWRSASGIAALILIPYAVMIIKNLLGFAPGQLKAAGGGKIISYFLIILLVVVCILQVWNVLAVPVFWPYYGAVVALLLGSMYQFVRLVLPPPPESGQ